MRSRWLALILALVCLAAAAALFLRPRGGRTAEIFLDGELLRIVDLEAITEPVEIPVGGHNVVRAEPGRVRMLSADCPDGLCVRMGWSSGPGKPIVCLPNRVTVVVTGGAEERDAVLR